jgi:hypothetical protein
MGGEIEKMIFMGGGVGWMVLGLGGGVDIRALRDAMLRTYLPRYLSSPVRGSDGVGWEMVGWLLRHRTLGSYSHIFLLVFPHAPGRRLFYYIREGHMQSTAYGWVGSAGWI